MSEIPNLESELPPHDAMAEGFLLACAVHRPSILLGLSDSLFYLNSSKAALAEMTRLKALGKSSVDVPEQFEHDLMLALPSDAFTLLNSALDDLPSPANWPYWLEIVAEHAQARALMAMNLDLESAARSLVKGCKAPLEAIHKRLADTSKLGALITDVASNMANLDSQAGADLELMWERGNVLLGIPTGFGNLNRFTNGLQPQKLYVIAGRPGKGKSSFITQLAHWAAALDYPALFMSLEMPAKEIYMRLVSIISHVNQRKFQDRTANQADFDNVAKARFALRKLPLAILDKALTLPTIISTAQNAIQKGAKLIIVDYIQKVSVPDRDENRSTVIGYVTSALKELAMKHDVAVLAAAQVNRDPEKEEREPMLSDLRESGAIENDADWVAFLHEKDIATTDLIIRKNRSGPEGKIAFEFRKELFRFDEK